MQANLHIDNDLLETHSLSYPQVVRKGNLSFIPTAILLPSEQIKSFFHSKPISS